MNKKLYRSREHKLLCGVCAGLGEFFRIDPTIIRVAFIIFACMGGSGVLAYLLCAVVIPAKPY